MKLLGIKLCISFGLHPHLKNSKCVTFSREFFKRKLEDYVGERGREKYLEKLRLGGRIEKRRVEFKPHCCIVGLRGPFYSFNGWGLAD